MVVKLTFGDGDLDAPTLTNADALERTNSFLDSMGFDTSGALATGDLISDANESDHGVAAHHESISDVGDVTNGPVLSAEQNQAWFAHSLLSNSQLTDISLPWETGLGRLIFSDCPFGETLPRIMPFVPVPGMSVIDAGGRVAAEVAAGQDDTPGCAFAKHVRCLDDKPVMQKRGEMMQDAICKLLIVIRQLGPDSKIHHHVAGALEHGADGPSLVMESVVGSKSPLTLTKRANSLLAFFRWSSKNLATGEHPLTEHAVWEYFRSLRDEGASSTKAASCLSALRFACYCLEVDVLKNVLSSRRIVGISENMLCKKQMLRQASAITVNQLKLLHAKLLDRDLHPYDRATVGFLLLAIYGRCRASDFSLIHALNMDCDTKGGYVEVLTSHHKTGRGADRKSRLLPILIPGKGITGEVFALDAIDALREVGVQVPGILDGPLLPAPSADGSCIANRCLTSSEISGLLREHLQANRQLDEDGNFEITSHSCKVTLLAWSAKFGLDHTVRSNLGRHSGVLKETYALYSRDLAVGPVRELQKVIDSIAAGSFNPDAPRKDFFPPLPMPAAEPKQPAGQESHQLDIPIKEDPEPQADEGAALISSESEPSDSSSEESSVSSAGEAMPTRVKRFKPKVPEHEFWYVNKKSRILHKLDSDDELFQGKFFLCGKRLNDSYDRSTESTAWNVMCRICNKRM